MPNIQAAMSGSTAIVAYNNDTYHIDYDMERLTRRFITNVQAVMKNLKDDDFDIAVVKLEMAKLLCQIVTNWDATNANGERVPFDVEHVAPLALMFMYAIFNAIVDDFNVKNDDGATSSESPPPSVGTNSPKATTRRSSKK